MRADGQLGRRRLTDFDWNADTWRLGRRSGFFRLGVVSVNGQSRHFCRFRGIVGAHWRIRQIAQSTQFARALESGENKKLSHFRMPFAVDKRTPGRRDCGGHGRTRSVRRAKCQNQDHKGENYAANWKYAENRQHQLCITESASIPKPCLHTVSSTTGGVRLFYHGTPPHAGRRGP